MVLVEHFEGCEAGSNLPRAPKLLLFRGDITFQGFANDGIQRFVLLCGDSGRAFVELRSDPNIKGAFERHVRRFPSTTATLQIIINGVLEALLQRSDVRPLVCH